MTQKEWSNLFSARIHSRLDYMGMTRAEFIEKSGYSQSTITNWCNGTSVPKAIDIVNIAEVLRCSVGYLIYYGEKVERK